MKWIIMVLGSLMALTIVLGVRACSVINDKIDRCDDQTSGKYIWDRDARRLECER